LSTRPRGSSEFFMTQNRPPRGKPHRSDDRPRREAGDKPAKGEHKPFTRGDAPRTGQKPAFEGRPRRDAGDKPAYAERKPFSRDSQKPAFEGRPRREGSDKPSYGERPSFPRDNQKPAFEARPRREADDKPRGERPSLSRNDAPYNAEPPAFEPQRREGRGHGALAPVPPGAVWLYGTHAVGAALSNPQRRFRRLLVTEEAQEALATESPRPWPLDAEITPRDKIDHLLGARPGSGIVHQGIALLTDQLDAPTLPEALQRPGPVLVLDQIFDPRNVGALMRTAQAFGASAVIAQERNAPEETGALAKAASGALEAIPLLRVVNITRTLLALKAAECWVVGLDGTAPTTLHGASFANRRVVLVLGSEGEGMRRLTRETCDEICSLAMPGNMESLNVSAAGAVALYELTRTA